MISDVRREVRLLPVFAHDHAVLLVAEFSGSEPGSALLLIESALGFQSRERAVDRPAVAQRSLRIPPIEHDAELPEVFTDIGKHLG